MIELRVEIEVLEVLRDVRPCPNYSGPKLFGAYDYISLIRDVMQVPAKAMVCRLGKDIAGYIPFFEKSTQDGYKLLNAQPFFGGHGGPYVLGGESGQIIKALQDAYFGHAESFDFSNFVSLPGVEFKTGETSSSSVIEQSRFSQYCVFEDFESGDVMDYFHSKTRNMVRKARKLGVEVIRSDDDEAWRFFYELEAEQSKRKGLLPKPQDFYEGLRNRTSQLTPHLYLAKKQGQFIAAVLNIEYASTIEYFTPVVHEEYKQLQPVSAIIAQAMQDALDSGATLWNFGGTNPKLETIKRFKDRWGARTEVYHYCSKARDVESFGIEDIKALSTQNPYFFIHPF